MAASAARRLIAATLLGVLALACAPDQTPARRNATVRPRVQLHPAGVENVRFGASPDVAMDVVRRILGRPDDDSGWVDSFSQFGTCPGSQVRGVRWKRLLLLFTDGETPVAESDRHFFSWRLSQAADPRPLDAATDTGLRLGERAEDVRAAYPSARLDEDPPGPMYTVGDDDRPALLVWMTAPRGRVEVIEAGAAFCSD